VQVRGRGGAKRAEAVFAGIGFHQCNELLEIVRRAGSRKQEQIVGVRQQRQRRELGEDIVVELLVQAWSLDDLGDADEYRITVPGRFGHDLVADQAPRAQAVFHDDRLFPHIGELGRDQAGYRVRDAAGGIGHDELDRPAGISAGVLRQKLG
jgi:hypothetical protein